MKMNMITEKQQEVFETGHVTLHDEGISDSQDRWLLHIIVDIMSLGCHRN